jgi:hypothetical protein
MTDRFPAPRVVHEHRWWSSLLAPVYLQVLEGLRRVTEGQRGAGLCRECGQPFLTLAARRSSFCTDRGRFRFSQRSAESGSAHRHELGHHAALSTDNLRYKLSRGEWDGADLYEVIAFAEAYRAPRGLILRSRKPGVPAAAALAVARSRSTRVTWVADPAVDPADAASAVADEAVEWVGEGLQLLSS